MPLVFFFLSGCIPSSGPVPTDTPSGSDTAASAFFQEGTLINGRTITTPGGLVIEYEGGDGRSFSVSRGGETLGSLPLPEKMRLPLFAELSDGAAVIGGSVFLPDGGVASLSEYIGADGGVSPVGWDYYNGDFAACFSSGGRTYEVWIKRGGAAPERIKKASYPAGSGSAFTPAAVFDYKGNLYFTDGYQDGGDDDYYQNALIRYAPDDGSFSFVASEIFTVIPSADRRFVTAVLSRPNSSEYVLYSADTMCAELPYACDGLFGSGGYIFAAEGRRLRVFDRGRGLDVDFVPMPHSSPIAVKTSGEGGAEVLYWKPDEGAMFMVSAVNFTGEGLHKNTVSLPSFLPEKPENSGNEDSFWNYDAVWINEKTLLTCVTNFIKENYYISESWDFYEIPAHGKPGRRVFSIDSGGGEPAMSEYLIRYYAVNGLIYVETTERLLKYTPDYRLVSETPLPEYEEGAGLRILIDDRKSDRILFSDGEGLFLADEDFGNRKMVAPCYADGVYRYSYYGARFSPNGRMAAAVRTDQEGVSGVSLFSLSEGGEFWFFEGCSSFSWLPGDNSSLYMISGSLETENAEFDAVIASVQTGKAERWNLGIPANFVWISPSELIFLSDYYQSDDQNFSTQILRYDLHTEEILPLSDVFSGCASNGDLQVSPDGGRVSIKVGVSKRLPRIMIVPLNGTSD